MAISAKVRKSVEGSSWIRRMFEAGACLRAIHGADAVCDFSLGNPDVDPPPAFQRALEEVVADRSLLKHGYMSNAGYPEARAAVARQLAAEHGVALGGAQVVMACGAAGGINAALKALLDPGDEVVASVPYFVEYGAYADNHGGTLVLAPTADGFELDPGAIADRITPRTAALIVNSPNNPTGRIYRAETLRELAGVLAAARRRTGRTVYILSDEPYRHIAYDGITVPSLMQAWPHTLVIGSHSKDLGIPGERIGYVAVHPEAEDAAAIVDALTVTTRVLGYVNAPALMQRVAARVQGQWVDAGLYQRRRDLLYGALCAMGYECAKPEGAFYLFPRAPGGDDLAFVETLQRELVLGVPGRAFGMPGYFRLAYCVAEAVIERSLPGFRRAIGALAHPAGNG